MNNYSPEGLARYARQNANELFPNGEAIYSAFKRNLHRKVQSLSSRVLTESELEQASQVAAVNAWQHFNRIEPEAIERHLSTDILVKAREPGFNLENESKYFAKLAKHMVSETINGMYKAERQRRAAEKKRRRV